MPHIVLLLLIATKNADLLKIIAIEILFKHSVAEGTGTAGNK